MFFMHGFYKGLEILQLPKIRMDINEVSDVIIRMLRRINGVYPQSTYIQPIKVVQAFLDTCEYNRELKEVDIIQ